MYSPVSMCMFIVAIPLRDLTIGFGVNAFFAAYKGLNFLVVLVQFIKELIDHDAQFVEGDVLEHVIEYFDSSCRLVEGLM